MFLKCRMIHRLPELLPKRGDKARLAEAMGISPSIITEICAGEYRLNDDLIKQISEALGVPPWHLFVDPESVYPAKDRAIVVAYYALPPGERPAVDKVLFSGSIFPQQDYPLASNAMHDSAGSQHRSDMTPERLEYIQKQLRGEI